MGRLTNAWNAIRGQPQNALDTTAFLTLLANMGLQSKAGVNVTVEKSLGVSTVLACTRALAEGIAQIPFRLMFDDEVKKSKTIAKDHPAHKVVSRRPNSWMTSMGFRETLMYHVVLTGNAFAIKVMAGKKLRELIPVPPNNVKIIRQKDRTLAYEVSDTSGVIGRYDQDRMFHLRGPSWDSYCGLEVIKMAREAIGLAIATEENHSLLHANGSQTSGILSTDKTLDQAAVDRLKELWAQSHAGGANKFKTIVLDNGLTYKATAMSGVDAEHIKTREHQIQEICRAMGVFPMIIGFADKTATFASAEAFFTAHVMLSLGPWVQRWQETADTQLITESDADDGYYFKLFVAGLVRGDLRTRYMAHQIGILTGFETRNEARLLEDMDPIDGLDDPLVPLNMGINGQLPPENGGDGPGGTQNVPGNLFPNVQLVPLSVLNAIKAAIIAGALEKK